MKGSKVLLIIKRVFKFQERWKEPWWCSAVMIACLSYCIVTLLKNILAAFK